MTQIADKEIARKKELDKLLDFMCQQLEQLEVIESIPKDLQQLESLVNRALDVRSACMTYLALSIRHDATILGTTGTLCSITSIDHCRKGAQNILDRRQETRGL
jgi:hypothetical protein